MKRNSFFIALILSVIIALIVIPNTSNVISLETSFLSLRINVGFLILLSAILGSLVTIFLFIALGSIFKPKKL